LVMTRECTQRVSSRPGDRRRVLFHSRDLKGQFVDGAATSDLKLVFRTLGHEILHLAQEFPHPLDAHLHDPNVRLKTVGVEQQAQSARLLGSAEWESGCSTLLVAEEGHSAPGGESEVPSARPGAAVSQSMNAAGTPPRNMVLSCLGSLWHIVSTG
jgi:hypothetical protein